MECIRLLTYMLLHYLVVLLSGAYYSRTTSKVLPMPTLLMIPVIWNQYTTMCAMKLLLASWQHTQLRIRRAFFCQECYFSLMVISFSFCFYNPLKQFFLLCKHRIGEVYSCDSNCCFGSSEVWIWWNLDHFIFSENSHSQIPLQLNSYFPLPRLRTYQRSRGYFHQHPPEPNHLHWLLSNYHYWSSRREVFIIEDGRNCSPNSSATHSSVRSEDCEIRA